MGLETKCVIRFGKTKATGKAWFEEKEIIFRSVDSASRNKFRLVIPLTEVKSAEAKAGTLTVKFSGGVAVLDIGEVAEKWAHKIKHPRGLLDKLGVKPDSRVSVVGVDDAVFLNDLHARCGTWSGGLQSGNSAQDFVFYGITAKDELRRLKELRKQIQPAGAIWVVWPKGRKEIREDDVRAAAIAAGLVDVKVVSFSETLSALKLMIPRDKR